MPGATLSAAGALCSATAQNWVRMAWARNSPAPTSATAPAPMKMRRCVFYPYSRSEKWIGSRSDFVVYFCMVGVLRCWE